MSIYRTKINYRKIFVENYGPIPKDLNGRSYEIHHIDGNSHNNDPSNLIALSIQEHYDLHKEQGDWGACLKIARDRKNVPVSEIAEIARKQQLERIEKDEHNLFNRKNGTSLASERVKNKTHNFLKENGGSDFSKRVQRKNLENGSHNFLNRPKVICPHCGKIGDNNLMKRYHFDKCKFFCF